MSGDNYPCVIKVGERYYVRQGKRGRVLTAWSLAGARMFLFNHPQLVRALLRLRGRGYSPVVVRVDEAPRAPGERAMSATYGELCDDIVRLRRLVKWCIEHGPAVNDLGDGEWNETDPDKRFIVSGDGCGCCAGTIEVPSELRADFFDIVREVQP